MGRLLDELRGESNPGPAANPANLANLGQKLAEKSQDSQDSQAPGARARKLLAAACAADGVSFEAVDWHLDDEDYIGFLAHENAARPGYWQAIALSQSTSAAGGFCSCRRCAASRARP